MAHSIPKTMTSTEWHAEATRRFGPDPMTWRFICPVCSHIASVADWKAAGATEKEVAFSCIGRHLGGRDAFGAAGPGPCNYTGGGLFRLNPITVTDGAVKYTVFAFAPETGRVVCPQCSETHGSLYNGKCAKCQGATPCSQCGESPCKTPSACRAKAADDAAESAWEDQQQQETGDMRCPPRE